MDSGIQHTLSSKDSTTVNSSPCKQQLTRLEGMVGKLIGKFAFWQGFKSSSPASAKPETAGQISLFIGHAYCYDGSKQYGHDYVDFGPDGKVFDEIISEGELRTEFIDRLEQQLARKVGKDEDEIIP